MKTKKNVSVLIDEKLAVERKRLESEFSSLGEKIEEVVGGWDSLLNKKVLVLCAGYFYIGVLTGVNTNFIQLDDCYVIYDVGNFDSSKWKPDVKDKMPSKHWNIQLCAVESYGEF